MQGTPLDGERACQERKRLIFAVDEQPFEISTSSGHTNRFCVLVPLMSVDGEPVYNDISAFPNRGRIWWLLRENIPQEQVVLGALWSGPIELATKWDPARSDNDKYQARIHDIQQGSPELIELFPVPGDDPDLSLVQRSRSFPSSRPTASRVYLLGKRFVLGPLRSTWDAQQRKLAFVAANTTNSEVYRIPRDDFFRIANVEKFTIKVAGLDGDTAHESDLFLTRSPWAPADRLHAAGVPVDASKDSQIINWAVRLLSIPRNQTQPLKDLLGSIQGSDIAALDPNSARKRERLEEIGADVQRVLDLGEEVSQVLAKLPNFEELIRKHADSLASQRIENEIRRREADIDQAVQRKRAELKLAEQEHQHALVHQQKELQARREELDLEYAQQSRTLQEERADIDKRHKEIEGIESSLNERIEKITQAYVNEADRFAENLLAQWPVLRKLALGGAGFILPANYTGPSDPSGAIPFPSQLQPQTHAQPQAQQTTQPAGVRYGQTANPPSLSPPTESNAADAAALANPALRPLPKRNYASTPIEEGHFLARFADHVERRGFIFQREDLINFHISVKTGGLTILAGLSGTGKSSLPMLYAEALGAIDEYLHVPVRPDWLDDRDLVGAFNALAQRFEPANSGLVEHLIAATLDAENDGGRIFFVCLDEMNLARVEHYFAQFLSVIELPMERRSISLFAPGVAHWDDPYAKYQKVLLGKNLRFLGTVNIDETTHFFSPKVLDRSQVVTFAAPDLSLSRRDRERLRGREAERPRAAAPAPTGKAAPAPPTPAAAPVTSTEPVSLANYLAWVRSSAGESTRARTTVLELNDLLKRSRMGLGYRQFDRILDYVESSRLFFNEDQALDFQISQIILPRLRPTAPRFKETLQELRVKVTRERFPRAGEYLARIAEQRSEDDFFQLL